VLEAMYGSFLVEHARNSADPLVFHEDVLHHVTPFLVDDYAAVYYRSVIPIGYRTLYLATRPVVDPAVLSKVLPYALLAAFLALAGATAARLGGPAAALGTVALTLSSGFVLSQMVGGTPRGFALPLLAGVAAAVVFGRPGWLAVVAVVAAGFYPSVAVIGGLALAFLLLVERDIHPGPGRARWARAAGLLGLTALGIGLMVLPSATVTRYGSPIRPDELAAYPEAGPGGRYQSGDYFPARREPVQLFRVATRALSLTLTGAGPPWWAAVHARAASHAGLVRTAFLVLTVAGLLVAARRSGAARRLGLLAVAALAGLVVACLAEPYLYLPERFITFPLAVLLLIGLPVAGGALASLVPAAWRGPWLRPAGTVALVAVTLALLGGRGDGALGFTNVNETPRLYAFLASLPPDALIAGWPGDHVDAVPYFARRGALVTRERHLAFHRGYVEEMRRRTRALIAAVFAPDTGPLRRLRDEWGVTHLVLDLGYYGPRPPTYFEPFRGEVPAAITTGWAGGFEVLRQLPRLMVFRDGPLVVLELARLR
jgi:hypothetical protein